jgi:hypothetical protein
MNDIKRELSHTLYQNTIAVNDDNLRDKTKRVFYAIRENFVRVDDTFETDDEDDDD